MQRNQAIALLEWYADAGVDECVEPFSQDFIALGRERAANENAVVTEIAAKPSTPPPVKNPAITEVKTSQSSEAIAAARVIADKAATLAELKEAVLAFDGCPLRPSAKNCVFADGNADSRVMLIGEAPGAEEDKRGIPFCGASGQLLDAMLSHVGLTRENFYITNTVFWRPPGNRKPTAEELAICLPLVEKHIALIKPTMIVLIGGTATTSLLKADKGITRLRGQQFSYTNQYLNTDIPVHVMYHPSFLLRQPAQKRVAWQDALKLRILLEEAGLPQDYFSV